VQGKICGEIVNFSLFEHQPGNIQTPLFLFARRVPKPYAPEYPSHTVFAILQKLSAWPQCSMAAMSCELGSPKTNGRKR
jgi:hypothetical protein